MTSPEFSPDTLERLFSGGAVSEKAWKQFLEQYSKLFLKIIWEFERDRDEVMEKYLYVCSKLAQNDFAVLRRFRGELGTNAPTFATWLRAVVRNLCIDVYRSARGRKRFPKGLLGVSKEERMIFAMYYWRGLSIEEIQQELQVRSNGSGKNVVDVLQRLEQSLLRVPDNPSEEKVRFVLYDENLAQTPEEEDPVDPEKLELLLSRLESRERLILRLRFWENIPALDIARVLRIVPEEQIYSILRKALSELRSYVVET